MRPYLAIVLDAFREALASRVLWVLIIGITFVLLALAPLGYRTDTTTHFLTNSDFYSPRELASKLRRGRLPVASPANAVWLKLDESQRSVIAELADQGGDNLFRQLGGLRRVLNEVIDAEALYDEENFAEARIMPEAEELLERRESLDETQRQRLNRLLLEGAFPEHFRLRPGETVTITYAMASFPRTWIDEQRLRTVIENIVLPVVMNFLLGVIAVLAALLVTSPVIPEMFAPGTLHLLLSKPLSRSLMFLARFFGGCFFIMINAAYLLIGLWLIVGLRFGLWNEGLLKCIPLFLFLFMVYYSVSALAGAYWKNAIVAVGVAAGLWGVCFLLGVAKQWMEGGANRASLRRLIVIDDQLIGVSENDEVAVWSEEDGDWEQAFEGGRLIHGPLLAPSQDMILATTGGRGPRFIQRDRSLTLAAGRAADGWSRETLGPLPPRTAEILTAPGPGLLAVAGDGLHQWQRSLEGGQRPKLLGIQIPLLGANWQRVGGPAEGELWQTPLAAGIDRASLDVIVYHRGQLLRFERHEDGQYQLAKQTQLEVRSEDGVTIACGGDRIALGLADGRALLIDRESLNVLQQQRPSRLSQPRVAVASPDGKAMAVVLQNGRVFVSRDDSPWQAVSSPRATTAFLSDTSLWIASTNRTLTEISLADSRVLRTIEPPMDNLQRIYRYVVNPLSMILPMPMELGETARFLLSGKETTESGLFEGSLDAPHEQLDPWTPVLRCSLFICAMLALGCWYIERQEF